MTPREIHTMQDILNALDASPELQRQFHRHLVKAIQSDDELRQELRREILTEELLQLPVRFTRIENAVELLTQDMVEVKQDMVEVKGRLATLEENQTTMSTQLNDVITEQRTMSGRIAHLMGNNYESRAIEQSRRLVRDHLQMLKAAVIHASRWDSQHIDHDMFAKPVRDGRITRGEAGQLEATDCIIRCEDENDNVIYAVVEISLTVKDDDRHRAIERAGILDKAIGGVSRPFVVGPRAEPATAATASATFLAYAPPDLPADAN